MQHTSPGRAPRISRRHLLQAGGGMAALATLSLTACEADDGGGTTDDQAAPDPNRPLEAPELTELVDAGDLPPLEERLPAEADRLVIESAALGVYGGVYHGAVADQGDSPWLERVIGHEPLLRYDPNLDEFGLPGALREVTVNDTATEFTLQMREGMKWSDGEPVTSEDIMFAINDVFYDADLYATPPGLLMSGDAPCEAEQVDEFAVKLTFAQPKGDFIEEISRVANVVSANLLLFPKHYMEQFLPSQNPDAEDIAEEAGFGNWVDYWVDRRDWWNNPERPVLTPWIITNPLNEGNVTVAERNPYYWKVDSGGAQLPYIDRLEFEVIQEEEVMLLKAVNGELDFHSRHFNSDANKPVLAEARETGDFRFVDVQPTSMNRMIIALNMNHQDEELAEIFRNKDFRVGLSHAIDRQDIIDTVYQRQGEPWQAAPHPDSPFYDEEFAKQYTEFDVDLANSHLDAAGLTEKDTDGFRLRPNGERLRFSLDVTNTFPEWAPAADLVSQSWAAVGVDMQVNPIERSLFYDRKGAAANEHDANVWAGDGGLKIEMLEQRWWFPSGGESNFAMQWAEYYTTRGDGENAVEPPEETKRQMELARQIPLEPDPEAQQELFREILQIAKEQFYVLGIALPTPGYAVVKNNLQNVAESFPDSWLHMTPGHIDPPSWFFSE
ncbi:ABC transporter substrate-binding protein [Ruania alba]|uniref:Peptide/nickel transport system substrate-binding protein n=1 Tax=Ruania alba TaxID=648782 RepID=A0A1H5BKV7_9MICO|nr:ABC transporter substrate-binding protein [Ruania alba]SED54694.1 peptide/nickel transport system substrate-binding protein [Ruania alba]